MPCDFLSSECIDGNKKRKFRLWILFWGSMLWFFNPQKKIANNSIDLWSSITFFSYYLRSVHAKRNPSTYILKVWCDPLHTCMDVEYFLVLFTHYKRTYIKGGLIKGFVNHKETEWHVHTLAVWSGGIVSLGAHLCMYAFTGLVIESGQGIGC
jgi:hypothetical protein